MHRSAERFQRLRVLVVDDYRPLADQLVARLRQECFWARAAYDAVDALAHAEVFRPDVLVSDIIMPGMSGYELADSYQTRFPESRILLLSADPELTAPSRCSQAFPVLSKGFDVDQVLDFLRMVEGSLRSRREYNGQHWRPEGICLPLVGAGPSSVACRSRKSGSGSIPG